MIKSTESAETATDWIGNKRRGRKNYMTPGLEFPNFSMSNKVYNVPGSAMIQFGVPKVCGLEAGGDGEIGEGVKVSAAK